MFSLKAAATACGVDSKTIRRHLPELEKHGATRVGTNWAIPLSALLADGFIPNRAITPVTPPPEVPAPTESTPPDTALAAANEMLMVRVESLSDQLRRADATIESERKRADDLAFVIRHQLTAAPPTPSPAPTESMPPDTAPALPAPKRGFWARLTAS